MGESPAPGREWLEQGAGAARRGSCPLLPRGRHQRRCLQTRGQSSSPSSGMGWKLVGSRGARTPARLRLLQGGSGSPGNARPRSGLRSPEVLHVTLQTAFPTPLSFRRAEDPNLALLHAPCRVGDLDLLSPPALKKQDPGECLALSGD